MWDFAFSYIGTVVLIALVFFSLFVFWIYGANVRASASKTLLGLGNNAVQLVKQDSSLGATSPSFVTCRKNVHYWRKEFWLKQKKVSQPVGAFLSDSVYHCANAFFVAAFFRSVANKKISYDLFDLVVRIILFVMVANLAWASLLGAWIIVGAIFAFVLFLMVLELSFFQRSVRLSQAGTVKLLTSRVDGEHAAAIHSYCKYQHLFLLRKYAMCFTQPFVEFSLFFWNFGKENK